MATSNVNTRVQRYRAAMRKAGLRPVQLWVPDTRHPDFLKECRRQSRLANKADRADKDLQRFMEAALAEMASMDDWTA